MIELCYKSAVMIILETIKPNLLGSEQVLNVNMSSIKKDSFKPNPKLIIYCESKLICDLSGKEKVDRFTILASKVDSNKLLEIQKTSSESGEAMTHVL